MGRRHRTGKVTLFSAQRSAADRCHGNSGLKDGGLRRTEVPSPAHARGLGPGLGVWGRGQISVLPCLDLGPGCGHFEPRCRWLWNGNSVHAEALAAAPVCAGAGAPWLLWYWGDRQRPGSSLEEEQSGQGGAGLGPHPPSDRTPHLWAVHKRLASSAPLPGAWGRDPAAPVGPNHGGGSDLQRWRQQSRRRSPGRDHMGLTKTLTGGHRSRRAGSGTFSMGGRQEASGTSPGQHGLC